MGRLQQTRALMTDVVGMGGGTMADGLEGAGLLG